MHRGAPQGVVHARVPPRRGPADRDNRRLPPQQRVPTGLRLGRRRSRSSGCHARSRRYPPSTSPCDDATPPEFRIENWAPAYRVVHSLRGDAKAPSPGLARAADIRGKIYCFCRDRPGPGGDRDAAARDRVSSTHFLADRRDRAPVTIAGGRSSNASGSRCVGF